MEDEYEDYGGYGDDQYDIKTDEQQFGSPLHDNSEAEEFLEYYHQCGDFDEFNAALEHLTCPLRRELVINESLRLQRLIPDDIY